MDMIKAFRKLSFKRSLLLYIPYAFICFVMISASDYSRRVPESLGSLESQEIDTTKYVSVSKFYPISDFAIQETEYETYTYFMVGVVDKSEKAYVLVIRADAALSSEIIELANASGNLEYVELPLYGDVETLPEKSLPFFEEAIKDPRFNISADLPIKYLYIDAEKGIKVPSTSFDPTYIMLIISGLLISIFPILAFMGYYQKRFLKQLNSANITRDSINRIVHTFTDQYGIFYHDEIIIYHRWFSTMAIPVNDLVWVFPYRMTYKANFLPFFIQNTIILKTVDQTQFSIKVRSSKVASAIVTQIHSHYPWIIIGYDQRVAEIYSRDAHLLIRKTTDE